MAEAQPLVTVITPAYNQEAYLADTIESVLAQDYPNLEYIVLNDGSRDDTVAVMQRYADRVNLQSHDNMGEPRTVNRGFKLARGKYVVVVNADDPILPELIRTQVVFLEANPQVVATYPDFKIIDEHSHPIQDIKLIEYDRYEAIRRAWCLPGPGAMIRRDAIEAVNGRDISYRFNSDMDFWFRLSLQGEIRRVPGFLAIRREHSEARGIALRAEVGAEIITLVENFFRRDDLPESFAKLHKEALSSAYFEAGARATVYQDRRRYFLRSFRLYPLNWIKYLRSLWQYGALIFPEFVYNLIRPVFKPYKWWKQRQNTQSKDQTP